MFYSEYSTTLHCFLIIRKEVQLCRFSKQFCTSIYLLVALRTTHLQTSIKTMSASPSSELTQTQNSPQRSKCLFCRICDGLEPSNIVHQVCASILLILLYFRDLGGYFYFVVSSGL